VVTGQISSIIVTFIPAEHEALKFRKDINGLRALAVIAVMIFHFNPAWMPGGFAGVDVFFVISGFLMTGIIFRGLEQGDFSLGRFYKARAKRITPPLAVLCLSVLVFGFFFFTHIDLIALAKHAASSILFISNITYWQESGYFDASSKEKWLLHTWSLSAEWQFYIAYPFLLVILRKVLSLKTLKRTVLIGTVLGFAYCLKHTYSEPEQAYFLLPTRAWEMMLGGVAFLYPFKLQDHMKRVLEASGLLLVIASYFFISEHSPWPGYLALFPVLGTFFIIQAHRESSPFTGNFIFQKIGAWSYSIYLWHWPIVVAIYYFSLNQSMVFAGIALSIFLGFISYKYIENFRSPRFSLRPLYMTLAVFLVSLTTHLQDGFLQFFPSEYKSVMEQVVPSPHRKKCHINAYQNPEQSCEYFGDDITWAVLGDSHAVEITYALAKKLEPKGIGLQHFSFSNCRVAYKQADNFSECAQWYNEAVDFILQRGDIQHVVLNHRFTTGFFAGSADAYPALPTTEINAGVKKMTTHLDELIRLLAANKQQVYVFHPIPELQRDIELLIGKAYRQGDDLAEIRGTDAAWYLQRNHYTINHFNQTAYPNNVTFIKPLDAFCDVDFCYAVKDGVPYYFDDDHPSVAGATALVDLMPID